VTLEASVATYFIDFENGNDANDGTTFANRWKTITNGATAARIEPGDEIRIMASPNPTSIGSATWTGGGRPPIANAASSTNTSPIVITTSAAHGLVANDYVMIQSHTTNTNANGIWKVGTVASSTEFQILNMDGTNTTGNGVGSGGHFCKYTNLVVKLSTPVTQNIALCGGLGQKPNWVASAFVSTSQSTSAYREGYTASQIAIAGAFTTGKAAYYTLPSTLDLSSYQQVSFWVNQQSGTIGAAGATYLALCSDTTGNTVVHTCNIPNLVALSKWVPVTVDLGTNLNSSIQSVAFYVVTDNGAQFFLIDNIIACKASSSADSLSLSSLISKSDGTGDEAWYSIQSINNDAIMISNAVEITPNLSTHRGYNGATETVTTYKRETIKTTIAASASTAVSVINDSGTSGSVITYSGGWNRTDMSTQTGRTWLDGSNGNGNGLSDGGTSKSFIKIDKIDFCRYQIGLNLGSTSAFINDLEIGSIYLTAQSNNTRIIGRNIVIGSFWENNCNSPTSMSGGGTTPTNNYKITDIKYWGNGSQPSFNSMLNFNIGTFKGGNNGNNGAGLRIGSSRNITIGYVEVTNGLETTSPGINVSGSNNIFINGGSTSGNAGGGVISSDAGGIINLNNFTINETSEVPTVAGAIFSNRHDNTDNNNWIWQYGGTINQQSSVVDSPATRSWKMSPTNSFATDGAPLALKIASVVCGASSLVTVTARMRRDNTGLTMRLVCPGGQISGVASDVSSSMTAAADTWETVTITFTPTKAGGVDIFAHAFGGTTFSGYVCNVTASQA
jgi:hypothetical protein